MKRPNITPGEWRQNAVAVQHDIHDVLSGDGATVAFIPGKGLHRKADGKAIAALPALMAALEKLVIEAAITDHGEGNLEIGRSTFKEACAALTAAGYTFD